MQFNSQFRKLEPEAETWGNILLRAGCSFDLIPENNRFATIECTTPTGECVSVVAPINDLSPSVVRLVDSVMEFVF